jgi:hypothetical protein
MGPENAYRAVRQLERMFMLNRVSPTSAALMQNTPHLCENCQGDGNHACTGKALKIVMVYDLTGHANDRVERKEIPCQCQRCHSLDTVQPPDELE